MRRHDNMNKFKEDSSPSNQFLSTTKTTPLTTLTTTTTEQLPSNDEGICDNSKETQLLPYQLSNDQSQLNQRYSMFSYLSSLTFNDAASYLFDDVSNVNRYSSYQDQVLLYDAAPGKRGSLIASNDMNQIQPKHDQQQQYYRPLSSIYHQKQSSFDTEADYDDLTVITRDRYSMDDHPGEKLNSKSIDEYFHNDSHLLDEQFTDSMNYQNHHSSCNTFSEINSLQDIVQKIKNLEEEAKRENCEKNFISNKRRNSSEDDTSSVDLMENPIKHDIYSNLFNNSINKNMDYQLTNPSNKQQLMLYDEVPADSISSFISYELENSHISEKYLEEFRRNSQIPDMSSHRSLKRNESVHLSSNQKIKCNPLQKSASVTVVVRKLTLCISPNLEKEEVSQNDEIASRQTKGFIFEKKHSDSSSLHRNKKHLLKSVQSHQKDTTNISTTTSTSPTTKKTKKNDDIFMQSLLRKFPSNGFCRPLLERFHQNRRSKRKMKIIWNIR
ncbi:hypothetical protein SNEBB_010958 [Seison nebaliae]|nr:hypothetical protein SNEBB_010958 [Seison nebaliae]